ncbi:ATP-binding protein [Desulfoscipio sp. XC116]|uniref:ATP-binding protein n=1 Tax=Desulfoscipio sp. XC116 TaxID=3144975 RepID=UPI00325AA18E
MSKAINFTMNYYALKTFGKQQYSNAWAALSELVANGFDAGAANVCLYINMRDKRHSTIEIIDDGIGMDENDLQKKYAVIGRNRRNDNPDDKAAGRKGIGKLAALYLSDEYQIISKKNGQITAWSVNVANKGDEDIPSLEAISLTDASPTCADIWDSEKRVQGTMLRLLNVDLTRIGDRAIDALKHRLSNYFLFDSLESSLYICIIRKTDDSLAFKRVEKQIAFDNMSHIYYSDIKSLDIHKKQFEVEFFDKAKARQTMLVDRVIEGLPDDVAGIQPGNRVSVSGVGTFYGQTKAYKLEGWIGVHSSIETITALKNDDRFVRNSFYNPNQIRVYVRNKLANENILSRLNLTGTYGNYIEGEVSFDILDDNDLEDIATANRQDFSIVDDRVNLLLEILRGLCRQLLTRRQELADKINVQKNQIDIKIQSKQKSGFAKETHRDLLSAGISTEKADELSYIIANKLRGEYDLKTSYKVFISHAYKDRIFTDFISHYLQHRGFQWDKDPAKTDIFYSSDGTDITNATPLAEIIKKMIIDDNTDILFLTSQNFMNSEYCLFEGGAAWATRSVLEYSLITLDYNNIPKFLTNGKPEFSFSTRSRDSFVLNEQSYTNIVTILNRLISHLNRNRQQNGLVEIDLVPEPEFKDLVQRKAEGKELKDYMDSDVYQYWQTYVVEQLEKYFGTEDVDKDHIRNTV